MYKILFSVFTCLISVCAFAPTASMRSGMLERQTLRMGFSDALGAQAPLGFWDPLNILEDATEERFERLRFIEKKHGRISMLAVLGHIVTAAGIRLPGDIAYGLPFADMKAGLAAFDTIPLQGTFVIFHFIGLLELGFNARKDEIEDFCVEKFPSLSDDRRAAVELNNGRAAQMGILALMVHENLNNDPYVINSLLGFPVPFN